MTVADLIRTLCSVPAEFRQLPVVWYDNGDLPDIEVVICYPQHSITDGEARVELSDHMQDDMPAGGWLRIYPARTLQIRTNLGTACRRCKGTGVVRVEKLNGGGSGLRHCSACEGTGTPADERSAGEGGEK